MSLILDDALDPERRAACIANDIHLAHGEPCDYCGLPQDQRELATPIIPERLRMNERGPAVQLRIRAYLLHLMAAMLLGSAIGQVVGATSCRHHIKYVPINAFTLKQVEV